VTADGLQFYLTGATVSSGTQRDPDASLGGYRAWNRAMPLEPSPESGIPGLSVTFASGANGAGVGTLTADEQGSVRWTPPGGSPGASTAIADGSEVVVAGADPDKFVRVSRSTALALAGTTSVQLMAIVNNVIGGSNFDGDEEAAGETKYRAVMLLNAGGGAITDLKVWQDAANESTRIAWEAPSSGTIQTIADEETAPGGVSWNTGTSEGTGLTLASLADGAEYGLWIERGVAADAGYNPFLETIIYYKFTLDGTTYEGTLLGVDRVAENGIALCGIWVGDGAYPDTTGVPDETFSSLPHEMSYAFGASKNYYLQWAERNQYGLWGAVSEPWRLDTDADTHQQTTPPNAPELVTVSPAADGKVHVQALYLPNEEGDTNAEVLAKMADQWLVYHTTDGDDPVPGVDEPDVVDMAPAAQTGSDLVRAPCYLSWTCDSGSVEGTTHKILVRTRRSSDSIDSENTTAYSATATWMGPTGIEAVVSLRDRSAEQQAQTFPESSPYYYDEENNVRVEWSAGVTSFYSDSTLLFRIIYDSAKGRAGGNNGFWTTFARVREVTDLGGAVEGDSPVEVVSATEIYIIVAGIRRMKFDVTNAEIQVAGMSGRRTVASSRQALPVVEQSEATCFQVWDPYTQDFATAAALDTDGFLAFEVAFRQRTDAGEIPTEV